MQSWISFIALITLTTIGCSSSPKTSSESTATPATQTQPTGEAKTEKPKSTAGKSAAQGPKVECKAKGDTRILEIRDKGKGCELGYTKGGQEGIVASDSAGNDHCQKTMAKIKDRLTNSGFSCQ